MWNPLSLLNLPAKAKGLLLAGVATVVVAGGAFGSGYLVGQRNLAVHEKNGQAKEIVKWQTQLQEKRVEVKVRDLAREQKLQSQLEVIQAERDSLKGLLRAKPDPDPNVYLRVGDVRLLNDAARPDTLPTGVSDPARITSYQEQASSVTRLRSFVGTEVDIREQYKSLAKRCDALVDWVNIELIQQQLDKKKIH